MKDPSCKSDRWRQLKTELNNLSAEAFRNAIASNPNAVILDVRTAAEYATGHIPNAVQLNYLSKDLWSELEVLPRDKDYFVYCRSGRRSLRVCTLMKNGGFEAQRIFNLSLGLVEWTRQFPNILVNE
ncbi:MAG: rhodanese-like domain-containing protein [Bacteroidota bacterium]